MEQSTVSKPTHQRTNTSTHLHTNASTHKRINTSTDLPPDVAIKVENVSKKFCKTLKKSMRYGLQDIGRNALGVSSRSDRLRPDEFWAVNDASFEVRKGEALGIIGPNGSGKTTILKMLNGIFWPDKGKISIRGKVGALIAVGAGFHPMLSGRENIYVNGAILGMNRHEIAKKFDAIIDFADIGDFLDTPVKHYSSGMYVRLGFAIAAHCNPDILLIDEVLAVGDMAFKAKCLDKMKKFRDHGKTIIFISHHMHQVEYLCDRSILLINSNAIFDGDTSEAIDLYRSKVNVPKNGKSMRIGSGEITVTHVELANENGALSKEFDSGKRFTVRIHYYAHKKVINPIFAATIHSIEGIPITTSRTDYDKLTIGEIEGEGYIELVFDELSLIPNSYVLSLSILEEGGIAVYDKHIKAFGFHVLGGKKLKGLCYLNHAWNIEKKGVYTYQK